MPVSRYLQDLNAAQGGNVISTDMFGANHVGRVNYAVKDGPFDTVTDALGVTHLRFPGGTVTEEVIDPGSDVWSGLLATGGPGHVVLPDGQTIQTLESTLDFASQNDMTVDLVLPTNFLLTDGPVGGRLPDTAAIDRMVADLADFYRSHPEAAHIRTIEIGNEYYYDGRMTAGEYGQVANQMVLKLDQAMQQLAGELADTDFSNPDLAVQSGAGWQPGDNETILNLLDPAAKAAVDAVVLHYYPKSLESVGNFNRHFGELQEWSDDPGFGPLKGFVSEWNIQNGASSDKGFMQASGLVSAFEELVEQGIDSATIWGTQYRALDSRLSTLSKRDAGDEASQQIDTDLTAAGEVFALMRQTLVDTEVLDIAPDRFMTTSAGADHVTNTFGNDGRFVAFVSSREVTDEMTLRLDLDDYFGSDGHVSMRVLYPVDDPTTAIDESDPTSASAEPDLDFLYSGALQDALLEVTLPPGAILVVEITLNGEGVLLEGQNPMSDEDFISYDDAIHGGAGDDTLRGHSGDDTLTGAAGRDILEGGAGRDLLQGGGQNDLLLGGADADTLAGGEGADILLDGAGNDRSDGGQGDDLLIDGTGDDTLSGGAGNDMIVTAAGNNLLSGGAGADQFVLAGSGHQTITDLSQADGDRVDLSAQVADEDALKAVLDRALETASVEDGITLSFSDDSSLSFAYSGQGYDDLRGAFQLDGAEDTSLRLAAALNGQSFDQVRSFSENLSPALQDQLMPAEGFGDFADTLAPQALLGLLSGADDVRAEAMLDQLEDGTVMAAARALPPDAVADFMWGTGGERLESLFEGETVASFDQWYGTMSAGLLLEVDDRLEGTQLPRPGIADHDGGPSHPPLQPPRPPISSEEEDEADEEEDEEGAGHASGDCFIATVAFRDAQHPAVWMLRWYRDTVLRRSALGRRLVAVYWRVGPMLARWLAGHPLIVMVLRALLLGIAGMIALLSGRRMGRQADHVYWAENRACRLPLGRHLRWR